jgi:hypothetical protein
MSIQDENPFIVHWPLTRFMKTVSQFVSRCLLAAPCLLLGCACLLLSSANAQNLLRNGDFESPLDPWDPTGLSGGKTNWTLVYAFGNGGPGTFAMKDRSTESSRHGASGHGVHLRPTTENWCHAYFTQTVTNLIANAQYVVSGLVNIGYLNNKFHVYIETLGGPSGTTSVSTPDVAVTGWSTNYVTNTASAGGTLEVRLHLSKQSMTPALPGVAKYYLCDARFDDLTLTLAPPTAPRILSLAVSNQTANLKWTSAVANTYDIEVSSNLTSWTKFQTNFSGTGANLTYTTNLVADPVVPQFFRVLNRGYVP